MPTAIYAGHSSFTHHDKIRKRAPRTQWYGALEAKFLQAIDALGPNAFPSQIFDYMKFPDLTRLQVAAHLQNFRKTYCTIDDAGQYQLRDKTSSPSETSACNSPKRLGTTQKLTFVSCGAQEGASKKAKKKTCTAYGAAGALDRCADREDEALRDMVCGPLQSKEHSELHDYALYQSNDTARSENYFQTHAARNRSHELYDAYDHSTKSDSHYRTQQDVICGPLYNQEDRKAGGFYSQAHSYETFSPSSFFSDYDNE